MHKLIAPISYIFLYLIAFSGCDSDIVAPEDNTAEKLKSYATYYDAGTFAQRRNELVQNLPADALILVVTNDTYSQ